MESGHLWISFFSPLESLEDAVSGLWSDCSGEDKKMLKIVMYIP